MRSRRVKLPVLPLFIVLVLGMVASSHIPEAKAAGTLFVDPANIPDQPAGTIITYSINVASIDPMSAFDIFVKYDARVLDAQSASTTGNMFEAAGMTIFPLVNCIDGTGTGCTVNDGPGLVHVALVAFGGPGVVGGDGLLFSMTFQVIGGSTVIDIDEANSILVDSTGMPVTHETVDGTYGSGPPPGPDFTITSPPYILYIRAGLYNDSVILLTSVGGFSGVVNVEPSIFSSNVTGTGAIGFGYEPEVPLAANSSATTFIRIFVGSDLSGAFVVRVTGTSGALSHFTDITAVIVPGVSNLPPVAVISAPGTAFVGVPVSFSGLGSYDPDGFIESYFWDFGDNTTGFGPVVGHTYTNPGQYLVSLTVTDNLGATGTAIATLQVQLQFTHDVAIVSIQLPLTAVQGQLVTIFAVLQNQGTQIETVILTIYADGQVLASQPNVVLDPSNPFGGFVYLIGDTSALTPGTYTVSGTVTLSTDEDPSDNNLTDGSLVILPPPSITVAPDSGVEGTTVTVHGTGFPQPPPGYGPVPIVVSFDNQFIGFELHTDGTFTFVFSIPHAEARTHEINALDLASGAKATTSFTVLESPPPPPGQQLAVSVDSGEIYFPTETAVIHIQTTLNGLPTAPDTSLTATLYKPDGSVQELSLTSLGDGIYKAEYAVPRTGSLGTYLVIVVATHGDLNASGMVSFEVKPTWISAQGPRIASATIAIGGILTLALAWRKGYFRRKNENELFSETTPQA